MRYGFVSVSGVCVAEGEVGPGARISTVRDRQRFLEVRQRQSPLLALDFSADRAVEEHRIAVHVGLRLLTERLG